MDELKFQHYLVVFLDHLGQREKLREITSIPTCNEEKDKFISSIRETLGKVLSTRDIFKNFYDSFNNFTPSHNLMPEQFHILIPNLKSEVYFYGISDSIVVAVPLMNINANSNAMRGIYSAFCAASSSALLSLSAKMVIRGGMDVGIATQIDKKEIYGPALERAYYIESKISEYPRFVAGNELITYLEWIESQQNSSLS